MKKTVLNILTIFVLLFSCKTKDKDSSILKDPQVKLTSEKRLSNWISKYGLEKSYFTDSSKNKAFELWAYTNEIDEENEILLKEYSIDSSYRLVSNFDKISAQSKLDSFSSKEDYSFGFLPKDKYEYYIGILFLHEHPNRQIKTRVLDYKWLGNNVFGILSKSLNEHEPNFYLTKLKIGTDTIWEYNPE